MRQINVGIIGCGLIGHKRALAVNNFSSTKVIAVCDQNPAILKSAIDVMKTKGCQDWREIGMVDNLDVVIVSTPNAFLGEIASHYLNRGVHVLIEKPMCRNLVEAQELKAVADKSSTLLKVGFNHRYHPGIKKAKSFVDDGIIGEIINVRISYGHGARPGYDKEWRGSYLLSGGGELTDQGVHVADLMRWFFGMPRQVFCWTQKAVWPLEGDLEDNAFGMLKYKNGMIVLIHTSWTQWKNKFQFEIFGTKGSIEVQGLGGSYGQETLILNTRNPLGGAPKTEKIFFEVSDNSWSLEWQDFMAGISEGYPYHGTPVDGVGAMKIIDAMYRSNKLNMPLKIYESK